MVVPWYHFPYFAPFGIIIGKQSSTRIKQTILLNILNMLFQQFEKFGKTNYFGTIQLQMKPQQMLVEHF